MARGQITWRWHSANEPVDFVSPQTIVIENEVQKRRTLALTEGFRKALAKLSNDKVGKRSIAIRGSYEEMIRQLENELREYDQLKSGKQPPLDPDHISPKAQG